MASVFAPLEIWPRLSSDKDSHGDREAIEKRIKVSQPKASTCRPRLSWNTQLQPNHPSRYHMGDTGALPKYLTHRIERKKKIPCCFKSLGLEMICYAETDLTTTGILWFSLSVSEWLQLLDAWAAIPSFSTISITSIYYYCSSIT